MSNNFNPLLLLKESYNSDLYDYFENSIYPKIKSTSIQVAKRMLLKYNPNFKIIGVDDFSGMDIDYVDPERKIYRACVEGSIDYTYIDDYGNKNDDSMYYQTIVFFNTSGWFKLARIYLGT